jgi:hypothetical protein
VLTERYSVLEPFGIEGCLRTFAFWNATSATVAGNLAFIVKFVLPQEYRVERSERHAVFSTNEGNAKL